MIFFNLSSCYYPTPGPYTPPVPLLSLELTFDFEYLE